VAEETKIREQVVPRVTQVMITAVQVAPMRKKARAAEAKHQACRLHALLVATGPMKCRQKEGLQATVNREN